MGGNNPITVQSMTNTSTKDINKTINQINQISEVEQILLEFHVQMKTPQKL